MNQDDQDHLQLGPPWHGCLECNDPVPDGYLWHEDCYVVARHAALRERAALIRLTLNPLRRPT